MPTSTTRFPSEEWLLIEAIGMAWTEADLREWWIANNARIRSLPEHERARVIAAKDRRKEELSHEKASHRVA